MVVMQINEKTLLFGFKKFKTMDDYSPGCHPVTIGDLCSLTEKEHCNGKCNKYNKKEQRCLLTERFAGVIDGVELVEYRSKK